ncbi:granzyme B-like [Ictidomys tridecemlineatus]|uniref:granzyme B-like n=1 Tax=Ictidomys tridecemlineatus TaxID=43179 RepID=UPI000B53CED3|nr:granzyme B-like [Ictidomys tridecemlineatus]KAG3261021.1 granzyme B-like [Ictidomys tridecemlineatus]
MKSLLLLLVFPLCPRTEAGKILGGQEAVAHSHPYMAFLRIKTPTTTKEYGGFLVREDFVLKAAHCWGSSITVVLGAHDIKHNEQTQQIIPVKKAFLHPDYNSNYFNDIMLLQVRNAIPMGLEHFNPGGLNLLSFSPTILPKMKPSLVSVP